MNFSKQWKPLAHYIFIFFSFVAFASLFYRDFLPFFNTHLLAAEKSGGYFAWLFWWRDFALAHGLSPFYSHFVMFPVGVPLFPHAPLSEIPAILGAKLFSPAQFVNSMLFFSHVFAGFTAYILFYQLFKDKLGAFLGAFLFAFSGYLLIQTYFGHVIETNIYLIPLFILAGWRFFQEPNRSRAIYLFLAATGIMLSGPYVVFSFGIIFSIALISFSLAERKIFFRNRNHFLLGLGSLGLAVLVGVGVYFPLWHRAGEWMGGTQFFSTPLISFFDIPFWNEFDIFKSLRLVKSEPLFREGSMAYLGFGVWICLGVGVIKGFWKDRTFRLWLWVLGSALLFCLGPELMLTHGEGTGIPLPYKVFSWIPGLSEFRVPGRIMMTATLAAGAITSYFFARIFENKNSVLRWGIATIAILFTIFEFDLFALGGNGSPVRPSSAYYVLRNDPSKNAVLEVPSSYRPDGMLANQGNLYLFRQTFHEKPIVLGSPTRYLPEALNFSESTDVVYELTHPWVLRELELNPSLRNRKSFLIAEGRDLLLKAGIGYVVYHSRRPLFDPTITKELEKWLILILGKPELIDSSGVWLFRIS